MSFLLGVARVLPLDLGSRTEDNTFALIRSHKYEPLVLFFIWSTEKIV